MRSKIIVSFTGTSVLAGSTLARPEEVPMLHRFRASPVPAQSGIVLNWKVAVARVSSVLYRG